MNGFPLVLLGIVLFVVAYALLKVQSKMKEVTDAIDLGFKTIEDGITQNLLGPTGAIKQASTAVDKSYKTIENGLKQNVLGPDGLLKKNKDIMNFASGVCIDIGKEIDNGTDIIKVDIHNTAQNIEKILQDTGVPLINAGTWFNNIGDDIDIDILGEHPLQGVAQPFWDLGKTCDDIGDLVLVAESDLVRADNKLQLAAGSLQKISGNVKAISPEILRVRDYVDRAFTDGVNASLKDMGDLTKGVQDIFHAVEAGAQTSVDHLKVANTQLDAQLTGLIKREYIYGLTTAAIALIAAGVALGV